MTQVNPLSICESPQNAYLMDPFTGSDRDTQLIELVEPLVGISQMKDVRNVTTHIEQHFQKISELIDISRKYVPKDETLNRQAIKIQDYQQNNLRSVSRFNQANFKSSAAGPDLDRAPDSDTADFGAGRGRHAMVKQPSVFAAEAAQAHGPRSIGALLGNGPRSQNQLGVFSAKDQSDRGSVAGELPEKEDRNTRTELANLFRSSVKRQSSKKNNSQKTGDLSYNDRNLSRNMSRNMSRISLSAVDSQNFLYKGLVGQIVKMKETEKIKHSIKEAISRIQ